ncbi:MAG: amino acid--tRNA ligase-related protein, partial [Chthoniobacteraceae bacterium]
MQETNDLIDIRRQKIAALREKGVEPFGGRFDATGSIAEVRARFAEGNSERVAGRITAHRDMGKSHFLDLRDATGRIQIFVSGKELTPEQAEIFKLLDLADFIGIEGECFVTKTGEPSLRVKSFTVLSKALRPMPSQYYGVEDVELKYRQRYLDLLVNAESREIFLKRIAIVREIREFLQARGFLEVETPMMQTIAGGAAAQPFKTHHNALGIDLFMRIAPELYLKRLLVGGFDKIFELNRNFRNEGISRRHNPEFTMLEADWAYADFEIMADLVEEMVCTIAEKIIGTLKIEHKNAAGEITRTIDLSRPWRRTPYKELVREV